MAPKEQQIDNLDRQIIAALQADARTPFLEIAKSLHVSGGTIHVRVDKLKAAGILKGYTTQLDPAALGYNVSAFIGLKLHRARDYNRVLKKLAKMSQVLEAHYTTGAYNIFAKVVAESNRDLQQFLVEKLQELEEIQSTETIMVLDTPIDRSIEV